MNRRTTFNKKTTTHEFNIKLWIQEQKPHPNNKTALSIYKHSTNLVVSSNRRNITSLRKFIITNEIVMLIVTYTPLSTTHTIVTDGSVKSTGLVSTYCVTKDTSIIQQWGSRFDENNTVYQTELLPILQALEWIQILTDTVVYLIFSESLSSLHALKSQRTKHSLVLSIKKSIITLKNLARFGHVSTDKCIFGNQRVDTLVKKAQKSPK